MPGSPVLKSPSGALARYRRFLARVSRRFERTAARQRDAIACRPGCFGCCVGLFEISPLDAALAAEGMAALPAPLRERIARRGEAIARRIARIFPGNPRTLALDVRRENRWDDFFEATSAIACPFLVPGPRVRGTAAAAARAHRWPQGFVCAIYEHRPHACRTFGLPLEDRGAVVSPPCRLNFRGASPETVAGAALPVYEPEEDAMARDAEFELGLPVDAATILPAVASGRFRAGRRDGNLKFEARSDGSEDAFGGPAGGQGVPAAYVAPVGRHDGRV